MIGVRVEPYPGIGTFESINQACKLAKGMTFPVVVEVLGNDIWCLPTSEPRDLCIQHFPHMGIFLEQGDA